MVCYLCEVCPCKLYNTIQHNIQYNIRLLGLHNDKHALIHSKLYRIGQVSLMSVTVLNKFSFEIQVISFVLGMTCYLSHLGIGSTFLLCCCCCRLMEHYICRLNYVLYSCLILKTAVMAQIDC